MEFPFLLVVVWPWLDARCPPELLLSSTGEKKYNKSLVGWGKDREFTQQLLSRTKQTRCGEISLMRCQSNQSRIMRDKNQILKHLLPPLPSSWAQLPSRFPYLLSLNSRGGWGMGVAVSSSHAVSAAPTSSGGGLLTLFPCSRVGSVWVGSLRWEAVLHNLLQCGSFPQHAVLHKLLQCRSCPEGAVLQEQAAPVWISCGVLSPASKPAPAWAPLSPQGHRSCQEPAPARPPHGVTASFRHPPALSWGPFHGLHVDIWSTMDCRGTTCLTVVFHHELQGKTLCSSISSTSSPSFFTDLGVCRVVSLTWSHSSLLTAVSPQFFSPS